MIRAAAINGPDGLDGPDIQNAKKWHVGKKDPIPGNSNPCFSCHEVWIRAIVRQVRHVRHVRKSRKLVTRNCVSGILPQLCRRMACDYHKFT